MSLRRSKCHARAAGLLVVLAGCREAGDARSSGEAPERAVEKPSSTVSDLAAAVPKLDFVVPELAVALPESETPAAFRLVVHANGIVDFDTQGWEQSIDAEIEAEKRVRISERYVTREAEQFRREGSGFRLDKSGIAIGAPTNHVHVPLYEVLEEATWQYRKFTDILGRDRERTLLLAIAPGVDMGTVHDLLFTAGRAEIHSFELLLRTPAGPRRLALELPLAGESPFPEPCTRTTVTVARDGAFVSLAGTRPLVFDPSQTLHRIAAGIDPHSPLLVADRRMLLDPDRRCPTVAAKDGVVDIDALGQRLAELPIADRCPATPVAFERDVDSAAAAAVLVKLTVDGHAPIVVHANCGWGDAWTDCSAGVRPGDPGFEVALPPDPAR
jgi:hypothetical protein